MPRELLVKLLRVIEVGRSHRVGCHAKNSPNGRIRAATARSPGQAVADRSLRVDFLYRLAGISVDDLHAEYHSLTTLGAGSCVQFSDYCLPGHVRDSLT